VKIFKNADCRQKEKKKGEVEEGRSVSIFNQHSSMVVMFT
jgi:hypothetical protein